MPHVNIHIWVKRDYQKKTLIEKLVTETFTNVVHHLESELKFGGLNVSETDKNLAIVELGAETLYLGKLQVERRYGWIPNEKPNEISKDALVIAKRLTRPSEKSKAYTTQYIEGPIVEVNFSVGDL